MFISFPFHLWELPLSHCFVRPTLHGEVHPIPLFIYIACSNLWTVKLLSFISGWGWGERWKAGQWNDEEPRPWGPRSAWHLILSYVGFLTLVEFFLFLSLHFLICKMGIINFTLEKSCGNEINHFKHVPWCPMESKHKMNSSYYYSGAKLIEDPNLFSKWTSGATMTANIYWACVWSFLFWGLSSVELCSRISAVPAGFDFSGPLLCASSYVGIWEEGETACPGSDVVLPCIFAWF